MVATIPRFVAGASPATTSAAFQDRNVVGRIGSTSEVRQATNRGDPVSGTGLENPQFSDVGHGQMVPRKGLSGNDSNICKINSLTPPRLPRLYQRNVPLSSNVVFYDASHVRDSLLNRVALDPSLANWLSRASRSVGAELSAGFFSMAHVNGPQLLQPLPSDGATTEQPE